MTVRRVALPALAAITLGAALVMAFAYAPTEAVQGDVQRIFYIHVPSAWVAYLAFGVVALASVMVLVRGEPRWDQIAVSSAEVGVWFTTITLVTGTIWGARVWGAWWVWEPRLTSTLVLWMIYVGYFVLRSAVPEPDRRSRLAAVVGIVGVLDIPVVHFAVTWWRGQHPDPTVLTPAGPQLPGEMLATLMVSLAAFTLLYAALVRSRLRIEELRARVTATAGADGVPFRPPQPSRTEEVSGG